MTKKQRAYAALVENRKKCRLCVGLTNPSVSKLRHFDSDHIGPWSRLHGDLNADLMVVGQDWGDVDYYVKHSGLDDLKNPTMRNLETILKHIGFDVSCTSYSNKKQGLFLTNAILCLKRGGLQAKIDPKWVENCGHAFLRHQIEIVRPRVVVGLGASAFQIILNAFEKPRVKLSEAISDPLGCSLGEGIRLFAAYHCGSGVVNRTRDLETQCIDWERIGKFLKSSDR